MVVAHEQIPACISAFLQRLPDWSKRRFQNVVGRIYEEPDQEILSV